MENNKEIPQKIKNRTTIWSRTPTSRHLFKEKENTNLKRYVHHYIHCSIMYVRQVGQGKGVQNGGGYKTRKGRARENETKEGPRTGVRTSGKTNTTPGWPNLHRTGPGRDKHINRGARASFLSLFHALGCSSPRVFRWTCPHASKMDFPAIF